MLCLKHTIYIHKSVFTDGSKKQSNVLILERYKTLVFHAYVSVRRLTCVATVLPWQKIMTSSRKKKKKACRNQSRAIKCIPSKSEDGTVYLIIFKSHI